MAGRAREAIGEVDRDRPYGPAAPAEPLFLTPPRLPPIPEAKGGGVGTNPGVAAGEVWSQPPGRRPRRRRRRWPWIVLALVLLAGAGTGVVWLTSSVARPVTLRQAESRLGGTGPEAPDAARPVPGVYQYGGSGTEKLSLPPLSQAEGPSIPGTVTLQGSGCFVFRIDYSTHHWQTWKYCLRGGSLWEVGGQSWQLWSIGPLNVTNLSSFTCARSMAVPAQASVGESWSSSCTGTNTSVKGTTVSTGPYRFEGFTTVSVGGANVRAARFLRLRTDSGAQRGTERSEVWFSASTGLPLRLHQDIKVTSATPFGTSTYTQVGVLVLESLTPHR